jgi:hypothetical protein
MNLGTWSIFRPAYAPVQKIYSSASAPSPASKQWADCLRSGAPFEMEIRLLDRRRSCYRWHLMRTVPVRNNAMGPRSNRAP